MAEPEICVKCFAEFPARKALVSGGVRVGNNGLARDGMQVQCPNCWHRFPARRLRHFGIVPQHALRWVVLGILAACVLVSFGQKHGWW